MSTKTTTDNLIDLLRRFDENRVRPSHSIFMRVITELERLQQQVNTLERRVKSADKEKNVKPAPANPLVLRVWEMFPPIPGSKYHRAHCARCNTPMRADQEMCAAIMAGRYQLLCEHCDPPLPTRKEWSIAPRQRAKLGKTSS